MFNSPTAQDVFGKNNQNLFGQFGMDPKGNNEAGAWARRNEQLVGTGLTNANDYALNTLGPAREANTNWLLAQLQPGNQQARDQRTATGMVNQGAALGNQQSTGAQARGYSPEYAQALRAMIQGNAQRNANTFLGGADQRMMQNQASAQGLIGDAMQNPWMQQFMQLAQLIEGRSQQNAADKAKGGLGGLMGMLGSILPMMGGMPGLKIPGVGGVPPTGTAFGQQSTQDGGTQWWTGN